MIRSISSIESDELTKGRLKGVQRLIETLYKWSTDYVSYAREATIASREAVEERTVKNWIRDAKKLRVLEVQRRGRASGKKTIRMDRIRSLVRLESRRGVNFVPSKTATVQGESMPTQGEMVTAQGETNAAQGETISPSVLGSFRNQEKPPPPSHEATRQTFANCPEWREAEAELVQVLPVWRRPLRTAQQAGVSPAYVLELIDYYKTASGLYGPGALHHRLEHSHPDFSPRQGWPRPANPSPVCRRAMECLREARQHPNTKTMEESVFRQLFRDELAKRDLEKYFDEVLFREEIEALASR